MAGATLALGTVHTYDLVTVFLVCGLYGCIRTLRAIRAPVREGGAAILALRGPGICLIAAVISAGYMVWWMHSDPMLAHQQRATVTYGLLPALCGWGAVAGLAVYWMVTACRGAQKSPNAFECARNGTVLKNEAGLLLVVWAFVSLGAPAIVLETRVRQSRRRGLPGEVTPRHF